MKPIVPAVLTFALLIGVGCASLVFVPQDAPQPEVAAESAEGAPLALPSVACDAINSHPHGNPQFPQFPTALSSQIPHDVDNDFYTQHKHCTQLIQRLFDIFSWQQFLAINWPMRDDSPGASIAAAGTPRWTTWKTDHQLFSLNYGQKHAEVIAECDSLPRLFNLDVTATSPDDVLTNVQQPDGKRLWDRHGNLVYYDIRVNDLESNVIEANKLNTLQGQIAISQTFFFPQGVFRIGDKITTSPRFVGSIEMKLAWKQMHDDDIRDRYFVVSACVPEKNGGWAKKEYGLIGMHISHVTQSVAYWTWSTFEQIDNTEIESDYLHLLNNKGKPLQPSFLSNLDCQAKECGSKIISSNGVSMSEIVPVTTPAPETIELNAQVREILKSADSTWQYYKLVGTQWTPQSSGVPKPIPHALANSVMETYVPLAESSCMNCHYYAKFATGWETVGITPTWGGRGSGKFSFLFQKAR